MQKTPDYFYFQIFRNNIKALISVKLFLVRNMTDENGPLYVEIHI